MSYNPHYYRISHEEFIGIGRTLFYVCQVCHLCSTPQQILDGKDRECPGTGSLMCHWADDSVVAKLAPGHNHRFVEDYSKGIYVCNKCNETALFDEIREGVVSQCAVAALAADVFLTHKIEPCQILMSEPKTPVCECGAKSCGVQDYQTGHFSWCPVALKDEE